MYYHGMESFGVLSERVKNQSTKQNSSEIRHPERGQGNHMLELNSVKEVKRVQKMVRLKDLVRAVPWRYDSYVAFVIKSRGTTQGTSQVRLLVRAVLEQSWKITEYALV